MPRKWKSTISCLQNLQAGEDISSPKQQKSMEPDPDLSDGIEEMKSEDDVVHLKYLGDSWFEFWITLQMESNTEDTVTSNLPTQTR